MSEGEVRIDFNVGATPLEKGKFYVFKLNKDNYCEVDVKFLQKVFEKEGIRGVFVWVLDNGDFEICASTSEAHDVISKMVTAEVKHILPGLIKKHSKG